MTGRWPEPEIDHDNRNRLDNRWMNLIETDDNNKNKPLREDNKTGYPGIVCKPNSIYHVYIGEKKKWVGAFRTFDDAVIAKKDAERKHGFHERHGEAS